MTKASEVNYINMNYNTVKLFEGLICLPLRADWKVDTDDEEKISINFPHGPYPKLGIHIESRIKNKTINNEEEKILVQGMDHSKKNILKHSNGNISFSYQASIKNDNNLRVWRVLNVLNNRHIRLLTLALSWPDNHDANILSNRIVKEVDVLIDKISFSIKENNVLLCGAQK